jgi:tetratricopeptide (TPR) repeat protein
MERMRIARDVRRDLERAVEVDPDDADALVGLIAFHRRAPGIVGGRERRADELLERLAELSPAHHATRRAMRNAEQQRYEQAAEAMGRALEAAPDASRQWRLRHARWLRLADRREAARQRLLGLLAAAPDYRPALFELGVLAREGGAAERLGIDALRRYLALPHWPTDPAPALAWQHLGRLYASAGERERARSALTRALGLDPELEPAREALDRIGAATPD